MEAYIVDKKFVKTDFSIDRIQTGEYEACSFKDCDFSNHNLSGFKFITCTFKGCNLSLVNLSGAALRDVSFIDCKLLGLHFETCNTFGLAFTFEGCTLDHSSFYKLKLKKTIFKNCQAKSVEFTGADLTSSLFDNVDLLDAHFENTLLEKADLRTAYNYILDPEVNKMKKARLSLSGLPGLLMKHDLNIDDVK